MKVPSTPYCLGTTLLAGLIASACTLQAQQPQLQVPRETERDLHAGFADKIAESIRNFQDPNRKVFKFDLDADINRDGIIDDEDNGWMEITPPGLVLKPGDLERARLRLWSRFPYFPGEAIARMEIAGINRDNEKGEFSSLEEEMASTAHIIIWADKNKKVTLVDSRDPAKRAVEWHFTSGYIVQSRMGIPKDIYIEAVSPSGKYVGDVRVVVSVQPAKSTTGAPSAKFYPGFDHMLFTVTKPAGGKDVKNVSGK
jgi:hypothetical protein